MLSNHPHKALPQKFFEEFFDHVPYSVCVDHLTIRHGTRVFRGTHPVTQVEKPRRRGVAFIQSVTLVTHNQHRY